MQKQTERGSFTPPLTGRPRITLAGAQYLFRKVVAHRPSVDLKTLACESWEIAPATDIRIAPAVFLDGHLARVTGTDFTDDPLREMQGGWVSRQVATTAYRVKDAWLLDGAVYRGSAARWFCPRKRKVPPFLATEELDRAAIYTTVDGDGFFGLWLTDDCATYLLAEQFGVPVTDDAAGAWHKPAYEALLGMKPARTGAMYLRDVVFFDDFGKNASRRERFAELGRRLRSRVPAQPHPGVFILRGGTGKLRIMINESEVAEHMRSRHGFKVVDITTTDTLGIVQACTGAQVVMGVEGSQLIHGVAVMEPGAAVFALQPPYRFCGVIKRYTDLMDYRYAFVVGFPEGEAFRVDLDEVERTLEVLGKSAV